MSRAQPFIRRWTHAFRDAEIDYTPARAVGYALATFADCDGTSVRPGIARLMVAASLSERSAFRAAVWLCRAGWIEQTTASARGRAAEYRLTLPPDVELWVKRGRAQVDAHREVKRSQDEAWAVTRQAKAGQ